jgi:hypothetical protein
MEWATCRRFSQEQDGSTLRNPGCLNGAPAQEHLLYFRPSGSTEHLPLLTVETDFPRAGGRLGRKPLQERFMQVLGLG